MRSRSAAVPARWGGLQRRVRLLVPAPVRRLDLALFQAVARRHAPLLDGSLPALSRAANHSRLWLGLAAVLAGGGRRERRAALRGVAAIGATSLVTNLPAKLLTGRTRPDIRLVPEGRRLPRAPTSTSFPSGHAASAFAFATAVTAEQSRLRWPLLGLASAVAASRVYTGVHYPGDVLVGSALGVAMARATLRWWPADDPAPALAPPVTPEARVGPDGTGLVVVANVGAGDRRSQDAVRRLRRRLPAVRTVEAAPDDALDDVMRRAAGTARALAVAGGDGTVSAAAQVARDQGIPLLVVAAGTFNHLARDLGLQAPDAAVRAVGEGRVVAVDLAAVDGRVFVNALGVGLYPQFVARRERLERRVGKWPAAVVAALVTLTAGRPAHVEVDGRPRRVWVLSVGNGHHRSDRFARAHRARLDAGRLEIRLLHAEGPLARVRLLLAVLSGRPERSRTHERRTTGRVRLRVLDHGARLARDGELEDAGGELEVGVLPGALLALQPRPDGPGRDHPVT